MEDVSDECSEEATIDAEQRMVIRMMDREIVDKYLEEASAASSSAVRELSADPVNDQASSKERSFLAYERELEDKSRQIAVLSYVVENIKLLLEKKNVRVIRTKDVFKSDFLLDEDVHSTRSFFHQLYVQFMKIFDTRTSGVTSSEAKKLNYAQAELTETMRNFHEDKILSVEPLLLVLIRCKDVLENYVKSICGPGKIECWKNVLENCFHDRMIISPNGNNLRKLCRTISLKFTNLEEKQIFTFLETHVAIKSELKLTEDCHTCLVDKITKQINSMANVLQKKEDVITKLNAKVASLTGELNEIKHKECSNCGKLEEEIKNIVREFEQKKQAQHSYTVSRNGELERLKSTIKHLKDDLFKERNKKCSDCGDLRKQLKDIVEKSGKEKEALQSSKESLMHEVENHQSTIKQLKEDLEFEKKPKRCEGCAKIDMQIMTTMNDLEQEKQALYVSNENLKREIDKLKANIDRLNDELNFNAMFNCNMILEHNEVVNDLSHQVLALQSALYTNEELKNHLVVEHKNALRSSELKIKQLMRKLSEHNGDLELQARALNYEHEKVVKDLKGQLTALQTQFGRRNH